MHHLSYARSPSWAAYGKARKKADARPPGGRSKPRPTPRNINGSPAAGGDGPAPASSRDGAPGAASDVRGLRNSRDRCRIGAGASRRGRPGKGHLLAAGWRPFLELMARGSALAAAESGTWDDDHSQVAVHATPEVPSPRRFGYPGLGLLDPGPWILLLRNRL
ncbi:hypothetical protein ES708_12449 [subsurface metagenome]